MCGWVHLAMAKQGNEEHYYYETEEHISVDV
jgi:hypothetical protein